MPFDNNIIDIYNERFIIIPYYQKLRISNFVIFNIGMLFIQYILFNLLSSFFDDLPQLREESPCYTQMLKRF